MESIDHNARSNLADNLKRLRCERGWSQSALGKAAGLRQQYVSGLEAGIYDPDIDILERLARVLETRACKLIDVPPA